MSWCGGGEISPTPGWVWRSRAISADTLWPGRWPPSPGLEPWAILMLSSSAKAQYSGVTPKRPEAICLIREFRSSAVPRVRYRWRLSPPSPQLLRAPTMLSATASVSWASADSEPCDIAPECARGGGVGVSAGGGEPEPADGRGGAGQAGVDDLGGQAQGFEDLGA